MHDAVKRAPEAERTALEGVRRAVEQVGLPGPSIEADRIAAIRAQLLEETAPSDQEGKHVARKPRAMQRKFGIVTGVILGVFLILVWVLLVRSAVHRVPEGQTLTVTLADSTRLILNSGSVLSYKPLYGWRHRSVFLKGEAYFDVHRAAVPFTVHTHNAVITVLGTRFNIYARDGDPHGRTEVTLETGRLRLRDARSRHTVVLEAGQASVVIGADTAPTAPHHADVDHILAWRPKKLTFLNEPVATILEQVEEQYAVEISVTATAVPVLPRRLTYIAPQPMGVEALLTDLCHVLALQYRKTSTGYEITAVEARMP